MALFRSLDYELQKLIKIFPEKILHRNSKSLLPVHSSGLNRECSARQGSTTCSTVCSCFRGAFLLMCEFAEAESPCSAGSPSCLRHIKEKGGGGGENLRHC